MVAIYYYGRSIDTSKKKHGIIEEDDREDVSSSWLVDLWSWSLLLSHGEGQLLDVSVIAKLGEDAESTLRMEEADVQTFSPLAGVLVDELYPLVGHFC